MKIDQDYMKKLLEACQASEKPTFDIEGLETAGFDYNNQQFEFHMMILTDQGFIARDDRHMTNVEGVFVAGDMRSGASLVVRAIGDGMQTAQKVMAYLNAMG